MRTHRFFEGQASQLLFFPFKAEYNRHQRSWDFNNEPVNLQNMAFSNNIARTTSSWSEIALPEMPRGSGGNKQIDLREQTVVTTTQPDNLP
jgi:hypothetical protein